MKAWIIAQQRIDGASRNRITQGDVISGRIVDKWLPADPANKALTAADGHLIKKASSLTAVISHGFS